MEKNNNSNIDDDPNILELDFSKMDLNKENAFPIPVKSNLPKHIDDVLEKELNYLMDSIEKICLTNIRMFEDVKPIFELNIKISLITEIKNNLKYLTGLTKIKQINSSKSIIADYLFNVNMVIALATGNKEKIAELLKFDRRKYDDDVFDKAIELRNKKQTKFDEALLEVYKANPNCPKEYKDPTTLKFYNASISFKKYRSNKNKNRLENLRKK